MQNRTLLLAVVLGGTVLAAFWTQSPSVSPSPQPSERSVSRTSSESPPPSAPSSVQDTLSSSEALRRIEHLHRLQARLARTRAANDAERIERLLHTAIEELNTLVDHPNLVQRPSFRQAFHSLTKAYETRYGAPDTLQLPDTSTPALTTALSAPSRQTDPPPIGNVLPTSLREQNLSVPLTVNQPVEKTMTFLLRNEEKYLYPWLRRASTYFPMIEQIFAEEGVPDELKYLALAESGLNPHAQSRAQAVGIWQFVAETGREYGLSIDPWVDERLDPEKSTRAAARHLKDLYEQFGDWQLALAGYNCNPGVVEYQIREYRERTGRDPSFWAIYDELPEETRNYVPLYTATALIISNPKAFNLDRVRAGPRYAFDYVPVESPLTVERVAQLAEVDVAEVKVLNPELRTNRLPPSEEPYYVRLPYRTYSTFASNYAALPEEERIQDVQHVLQSDESLGRVAQRYHVDRSSLLEANDEDYPVSMQIGQRLSIPEKTYAGNAQIVESADEQPIRVRYGSRTVRSIDETSLEANLTASLSRTAAATP